MKLPMSEFFDEIKTEKEGFVIIRNKKAIYSYLGKQDYSVTDYSSKTIKEFVFSFLSMGLKVQSYPLDDDSVVLVIEEPQHIVDEFILLFYMFNMISIKPNTEIISSIVGVKLDNSEIDYLKNTDMLSFFVDTDFENTSNVVTMAAILQVMAFLYNIKQKIHAEMTETLFSSIEKSMIDLNNIWQQTSVSENMSPKIVVRGLRSRKTSSSTKTKEDKLVSNIVTLIEKINDDLNQTLKPHHKIKSRSTMNTELENLKKQLEESSNIVKKLKKQLDS